MATARDRIPSKPADGDEPGHMLLGALPVINAHLRVLPENDRGTGDSCILSGPHTIPITLLRVIPARWGRRQC